MDQNEAKVLAARAALALLPERGVIGLGSGSTAKLFIDAVGELVKNGRELVGVATSDASRRQALALGIPLLGDDGPWSIDVCVDGADEVSEALDLIKGGGAAHTREKIVNHAARTNVIIVDESKLSTRLGERWPVPIEVLAFAYRTTLQALASLGEARLRERDGALVRTDAGNFVCDLKTGPIEQPSTLEKRLKAVPGVVETGLFCARADVVIVAGPAGIRELRRG
jgi:ribose 5-phosphate isomerase A